MKHSRRKQNKARRTSLTPVDVEAWFRTTLYSIGDAVITTDRTGRILQMNHMAEQLTGWKEAKARGKKLSTVFRIVNEETRKKVENPVTRVLREGAVVGLANHTLLIRKDKTKIPIADSGAPIFDNQKNIVGVVVVFRDQSAERNAQRLVSDAREFAESIVATIREPLLVLDGSLEVVAANNAFYRVFAVQPDETIGKKVYRLGKGQWNIPKLRSLLQDTLRSNSQFDNYEIEHDFERIGVRTMLLNARRLQRAEGRSGLILLAIEDITERRRAEREKAQVEERFTHISQLITDYAYAFRVTPAGTLQGEWLSDSFTKTFGYTTADIDARGGWQSLLHPDDVQIALRHAQKVIAGEPDVCELRFLTRTGNARWLRDVAVPIWNAQHTSVVRIYGAAEDITERKEAEQALRANEERLRTILETEPECVKVLSPGGMLIQMNPAGLRMIEAESLEQVAGKSVLPLVTPEHRDAFRDLTARVLRGESASLQFEIVGLKGTRRWLETHAVPLRDEHQRIIAVLGITRDITEAKRAADAIRQSEEQFRVLAESALTGIYLFQENIFRYVNPAFEQIFGYEPGEIVGKLGPMDLTHPDDRHIVQQNVRRRELGEIANIRYEFRGLRKDGSIIFVEVHGARLLYHGKPAIIGTLIDITERKRSELRIRQLNRVYAVLSDINQAIVRIHSSDQLLAEACRIAVEKGGLRFAWIAKFNPLTRSIEPVASAGYHEGYLERLGLSLDEERSAIGPTLTALREGRRIVCNDIANDLPVGPWREEALRRGYRSCAVFPLRLGTTIFGTYNLHASEPGFFTDEELHLLDELAMDISFALEAYHREEERKQAEAALREREEQYRILFEAAPIGIGVTDRDGKLLIVNKALLEQGGYTADDSRAIGNAAALYHNPAQHAEALALLERQGSVHQMPVQFKRKDGTLYDALLTLSPVNIHGRPCIQAIVEDITARKQAEAALAASEAELRALFSAMRDLVLVIDRDGVYRRIAPTNPVLLYQPAEDLLGKRLHDVFPREQADRFLHAIHQALGAKQTTLIEYELTLRGQTLSFSATVSPMNDVETLWVIRDVTEWRRASEQITMLAHALRSVEECVSMTDMNENLIFVNEAFQKTYGYTETEILGKHITILRSPYNDARVVREILPSTLQRGGWRGEVMNRRKDGTDFPIFLSTSVVKDDQGKPVALIGVANDFTERKKAEQALRESEEKFRTVAETAATAIFIYQGDTLRYVNRYATAITGYTRDDLLKMKFWEIIHPEHRELVRQRGLARQRGEDVPPRYEFKILTKSGDVRWLDFTAGTIQFQGEPAAVGTAFDITDRKNAEEALRWSEDRYREFFEQDLTADYIATRDGTVLMCNPAFVRMFGFASEDDAMRTNLTQLWPSPEKRGALLERLKSERVLKYYPLELRRRDGSPVYVIANIIGIFNADDEVEKVQAYLFDDTPRKILEHQLRQAQKMESLGTLAGGIAHDFNNILGIILGYATMLQQATDDRERMTQTLEAITKATQRGAALVKQLLTFARKSDAVFESVLLNNIISEIERLVRGTFPKTIEIETSLFPTLPPIVADATQMHQVLLNLCVNARDAMPKGGRLAIRTGLVPLERIARQYPTASAREYALIEVSDTGIGMDEATRQRIFDPFFTTKGPGKGTGLGLALVYGIIENHNGFIDVESRVGKGTTFRIYLPISEHMGGLERPYASTRTADLPGGQETILIVEDEEMLRDLVQALLTSKGYVVLTARDGDEGVHLYKERGGSVDLVISDLGLPKIGGDEVARRIREMNPHARIVIASGFIDPSVKSELQAIAVRHFIQKPYQPESLLRTVRELLDTHP